jgi:alanyl-tRNA synthetase
MTERLYYHDSALRSFQARVADIRELSRTAGQSIWQIALDRTAFYPTSGGQPFDTGMLRASSRSGAVLEIPVLEVEEDETGFIWHATPKPITAATEVEGVVDWDRRRDHMQQHSGQHLLSAVFAHELNAHTVSFHLGEETSTIDLNISAMAQASLERVERIANEIIAENRSVRVLTVSREEAEKLQAEGKLRKLPPREGAIRLIEIEEYDLNACGGTHVQGTGQIGGLFLRGTEKVRQGIRVEFVCGLRAVTEARREHALLTHTAAVLSLRRQEIPEAVERLISDAKVGGKERQRLRESLADYQAIALARGAVTKGNIRLVRQTLPGEDAMYIRLLASRIAASEPDLVALLASTAEDPAAIVLAAGFGTSISCGELVKAELAQIGLRGGGSRDLAQGQIPVESVEAFFDALEKHLLKPGG